MVITVYGTPAPQGSKRAFYVPKLKRAIITEDNPRQRYWFQAVREAAMEQADECNFEKLIGPVRLIVTFTLLKPKSAPKGRLSWPDKKPDLSKLVRCTEDALTHARIWEDDSRVVESFSAKRFPREGPDALEGPGAIIRVEPAVTWSTFGAGAFS